MFLSNNKQKTLSIATIYFFVKKIINDVFFNFFRSINGILYKTPFYKYKICDLNYQFFNVFKGFTILLCQIHLPLENKSMFLHPKLSFSVIFFEFPCFNLKYEHYIYFHYTLLRVVFLFKVT